MGINVLEENWIQFKIQNWCGVGCDICITESFIPDRHRAILRDKFPDKLKQVEPFTPLENYLSFSLYHASLYFNEVLSEVINYCKLSF